MFTFVLAVAACPGTAMAIAVAATAAQKIDLRILSVLLFTSQEDNC
ncbi:MAG: hypothetical protein P8Y53_16485 [Pseudolabrys sp.]